MIQVRSIGVVLEKFIIVLEIFKIIEKPQTDIHINQVGWFMDVEKFNFETEYENKISKCIIKIQFDHTQAYQISIRHCLE